jgi:hypothetical protein
MVKREDAALKTYFYRVSVCWYSNPTEMDWISWNLKSIEWQFAWIISWIQNIQRKSVCSAMVFEKLKAARVICHAWLCAALMPVWTKSWPLLLKATMESVNIDCGLLGGGVSFTQTWNRPCLSGGIASILTIATEHNCLLYF